VFRKKSMLLFQTSFHLFVDVMLLLLWLFEQFLCSHCWNNQFVWHQLWNKFVVFFLCSVGLLLQCIGRLVFCHPEQWMTNMVSMSAMSILQFPCASWSILLTVLLSIWHPQNYCRGCGIQLVVHQCLVGLHQCSVVNFGRFSWYRITMSWVSASFPHLLFFIAWQHNYSVLSILVGFSWWGLTVSWVSAISPVCCFAGFHLHSSCWCWHVCCFIIGCFVLGDFVLGGFNASLGCYFFLVLVNPHALLFMWYCLLLGWGVCLLHCGFLCFVEEHSFYLL